MSIRVGGFFSGIGSHISACERLKDRADFVYVFQCEWDERTAKASDDLHGKIPNLGDITKVENIGGPLAVDLLFWTPPCQDISNAGRMAGNDKDSGTRSSLAYEVPRILAATEERERPRYLIMEEVPMMVSKKFKANFDALLQELQSLGYQHEWGIISATDCGVAQSRRRCFVISKYHAPAPKLPKPIPLQKCLKDYLDPEPVPEEYYLSEERLKGLIWSNQKEEANGNNYRFSPTDGGGNANTITSRAGSRKIEGVSPTLWAGMGKDPPRILIPTQTDSCRQVAMLDSRYYKQIEMHRRVYSIEAASPTIPTNSGGGNIPLIIEGME